MISTHAAILLREALRHFYFPIVTISTHAASVAPFRKKLARLMSDESLTLSQIYNGNLRMIRELIKEQHMGGHQTKISSFFGPRPVRDGAPASHFPSLLGTPPAPKDCTNTHP